MLTIVNIHMPTRCRLARDRGYSLLEMVFVTGIIAVIGGVAAVQISQTRDGLKGDAAMRVVQSQLSQAREMAITQRRFMRVTFDALTNQVSIVREDTVTTTTTLQTIPFEGGATFSLVAGVPDTPDAFGKSTATTFTSANGTFASAAGSAFVAKFGPDGTLVDWNGATTNGTVFTSIANIVVSARAVTILGSTGRVRAYRWDGRNWNKV